MPANSFSLQGHLDGFCSTVPRRLAFAAHTLREYFVWQAALRSELIRLLGLENRPPAALTTHRVQALDRGTYVEEKYALDVGEGVLAPIYLLMPKREPPYKPVLVFHGHDPSAQYCLGNYPDPETAQANLESGNNYAQALAQAGYLVCVVEQRGLGERLTGQVSGPHSRSCRHLAFSYLLHGRTLLGERIWDGMCAATFLLSRRDVSGGPGCTGHSAGGTTALWLSALDERIASVFVSGYFNSFGGSLLAMEHCECNYVPGILELAEMGDIAALIAPRPFCALNGEQDELFPPGFAREQYEIARRAYALHTAQAACRLLVHAGGHTYDNTACLNWFSTTL